MHKTHKISPFRLALFQAIVAFPIGLLAGCLYAFGGAAYDYFTIGFNRGTALAFFALIAMPIIFSAFAFVFGIVEAILFNLILYFYQSANFKVKR